MNLQSILIVCEGKTDKAFLTYLKFLFQPRNNTRITIKQRKIGGGSPQDIVSYAQKYRGAFSCRVALFDTDKTKKEIKKAEDLAQRNEIHILKIDVCLEKFLLQILNYTTRIHPDCKQYKKQLHEHYIPTTKMQQWREYQPILPKSLLIEQRKSIPILDEAIKYIQDGCPKSTTEK
ncbi:MAG: RloB domain-containing protein [Candidatus Spechtbacteria bacterium SB0662_bin_43]|uniref:RloB domain-containing protein n=1 Tax=Candidatus Spechtbacteria bacterium SB0662_bin_43 TaxID=2604897 RepID=A0A845DEM9_9BACT|nr:RloB domain-containing protein [Candidatus Spechtbacteria bacterium SB0662_bin_43]